MNRASYLHGIEGHEHGEAAEVRALAHREGLVGFVRPSVAAGSGPVSLLRPVRADEFNPLRFFHGLYKETPVKLINS